MGGVQVAAPLLLLGCLASEDALGVSDPLIPLSRVLRAPAECGNPVPCATSGVTWGKMLHPGSPSLHLSTPVIPVPTGPTGLTGVQALARDRPVRWESCLQFKSSKPKEFLLFIPSTSDCLVDQEKSSLDFSSAQLCFELRCSGRGSWAAQTTGHQGPQPSWLPAVLACLPLFACLSLL